jgi:hypothetical protein
MTDRDDPPRGLLIAALVVGVAAVAAVLAVAAVHQHRQQPVTVAAVPAPHAADPVCRSLLAELPQRLGDYRRAAVAQPVPDGTAAWAAGRESVVLRCGLDRPADFVLGSPVQIVDAVQWFGVRTDELTTWYAVDRPVYVALTLPSGSGPAPIQQLSGAIDATMPAVPIQPGPPA